MTPTMTKQTPKPTTMQLLLVSVANKAHPQGNALFDAEARWMPLEQAERFDASLRTSNTPILPALSGRPVPTQMDIEKMQRYEHQVAAVPDVFAVQRNLGRTFQDPGIWLVRGPNVLTQSPVGQNRMGVWETKEGVEWVDGPFSTIAEAREAHPEIPPADLAPVAAGPKETPEVVALRTQVKQLQDAAHKQAQLHAVQRDQETDIAIATNEKAGKAASA